MNLEEITLGGGCFWCIENIFSRVKGITKVVSGYANGDIENPSYEQVCSGTTNHAEVVKVEFDPAIVSFETILEVFFAIHDPTTLNRQGNDIGSQYRSIIVVENDEQQAAALEKIKQLTDSNAFEDDIVTVVEHKKNYYAAEDYHQDYYNNNTDNQYCQLVVAKKIQKFLNNFSHLLKDA
ncbi:peptide-methionine (S)-S-oxide reductase MsrA [Thalassotalea castellviae]|uniref:Peptide methionine sulfoxide reductase MsrA n=1 Tax=Thalassotalea castellviae TaxID=3075612 RepID=A0ABU2ZZT8_9GAMM|nr:peptide-methionine (S)-S-oxide reductase MsrA [Thalassotalea sp. W431]MDT0603443.1 peptide-methionine (S)-S-oxide reductase MsrA [Thalassotalea sp. W431]